MHLPFTGLKNGTRVWTPHGLTPIEQLQSGSLVVGGDGTACKVLAINRNASVPVLRLTFDRGLRVECGAGQTWKVLHPAARFPTRHSHGKIEPNPRYGRWEVVTASDMLAMSGPAPLPRRRFLVPVTGQVEMHTRDLPVDPYLMGLLLGDGCFRNGVSISSADEEIVCAVVTLIPPGLGLRKENRYDYKIVLPGGRGHGGGGRALSGNPLTRSLRELGLYNLLSMENLSLRFICTTMPGPVWPCCRV